MIKYCYCLPGAAVVCLLMSGCGGGGGDDSAAPPLPKHSQEEVINVAKTGVWMNAVAGKKLVAAPAFFGGFLQAMGSDVTPGGTAPAPCRTGTGTTRINKLSPHVGLLTGDEATLTYNQCDLGGIVVNGTAKLTLKANVVDSTSYDINTYFDAVLTSFATTYQNATDTLTGAATMRLTFTNSLSSMTLNIAVPPAQTLALDTLVSGSPLRVEYAAGATFANNESATPDTVSRKLDSTLRLQYRGLTENYNIKTPIALSGTSIAFNSGTVESQSIEGNLATSTTISGINAQISGDTDQNGSKDLTVTVLASSLLP